MNLFQIIKSDFFKYKKYGGNFFTILFFTQGFWAIVQYRIANMVFRKINIIGLRQVLLFVLLIWQKGIEITTGISIPASVQIGNSFYIGHFGGIIINANAVIGNNCNISQGVTIGISGIGEIRGVPVIGDNVYIGANSVLVGNILVANDVLIGACSLVTKNTDECSVLMGVPAIKISDKGSKGYI